MPDQSVPRNAAGASTHADMESASDVQGQSPPRAAAAPGAELGTLPLTVALSPQRSRTAITFAGKLAPPADAQRPALAVFGHEPGSRVYEGLFPKFQLPNGKQAFFYYTGGGLQARCCCLGSQRPPRHSCVLHASRSWTCNDTKAQLVPYKRA